MNAKILLAPPKILGSWNLAPMRVSLGADLTREVMRLRLLPPEDVAELLERLPTTSPSRLGGATWVWTRSDNGLWIGLTGDVPAPNLPEGQAMIQLDHEVRLDGQ